MFLGIKLLWGIFLYTLTIKNQNKGVYGLIWSNKIIVTKKGGENMRIANKKKFVRSTTIAILLLMGLFNISIAKSNKEAETIDYTIARGQTLWSIAREYTPNNKDIRDTIHEIRELNNLTDATIYEGQTIKIKIEQ